MLTWALVYLAVKGTMKPETYVPFFVSMGCDTFMIYALAIGIGNMGR